jgi:hypothetical protein
MLQAHSDGLVLTASAASSRVMRLFFFPAHRNIQPRAFVCYIDGHYLRCRDAASHSDGLVLSASAAFSRVSHRNATFKLTHLSIESNGYCLSLLPMNLLNALVYLLLSILL